MGPLLARTAVLLVVAAGLGAAADTLRSDGARSAQVKVTSTCSAGTAGEQAVRVVPPGEAMRMCGDPGVMVADVRTGERFAAGHIAEAVHLPCASNAAVSSAPLARLERSHTVVVYGDSTDEARPVADALLARIGQTGAASKVVVLEGGFAAWDRAGLACSSGPCPHCQEQVARQRESGR